MFLRALVCHKDPILTKLHQINRAKNVIKKASSAFKNRRKQLKSNSKGYHDTERKEEAGETCLSAKL